MGIVLSRFRAKKTTIEILEDLDAKIKEIQEYGQTTEQRHKKIVGTLVIYSVVLYIITAFIFYFYFFPASLYDQIFYITPLLIFPILILFTKKMVSWYYKRKISHNQEKLVTLQQEKSKILDEVTETETYKKAKEILLRFAPDQLKVTSPTTAEKLQQSGTPQNVLIPSTPNTGEIRRRTLPTSNLSGNVPSGTPVNPQVIPVGATPIKNPQLNTPASSGYKMSVVSPVGFRTPLPRPVLPLRKSYLDRLVDYLVGDGPSNRYALICRQCECHNGMALKEEFEYFGFRCCYCNFWNPPKKQKPGAPRLEFNTENLFTPETFAHGAVDKSVATKQTEVEPSCSSDTDSDIEVVERPNEISETEEYTTEKSLDASKKDLPEENRSGVQSIVESLEKEEEDRGTAMEVDD